MTFVLSVSVFPADRLALGLIVGNSRQLNGAAIRKPRDDVAKHRFSAPAALAAAAQDDAFRAGIECRRKPPHTVCGVEAQLLHIRVARPVERVHAWPAEQWAIHISERCYRLPQ